MSNNNNKSSSGVKPRRYGSWIVSVTDAVRLYLQDSLFQEGGIDFPEEIQRFFGVREGIQKEKDFSQNIDLTNADNKYKAKVFLNSNNPSGAAFCLDSDTEAFLKSERNRTYNAIEIQRQKSGTEYRLLLACMPGDSQVQYSLIQEGSLETRRELTAEELYDLFQNADLVQKEWADALYDLYRMPGHTGSCMQLMRKYGKSVRYYLNSFSKLGSIVVNETNREAFEANGTPRYWPVLFTREATHNKSDGCYYYHLNEPVMGAVVKLANEGFFVEDRGNMVQYDHNQILYGPPGTGKTYHSVIYAVAICEGKNISEVEKAPFEEILHRYRVLEKAGRISFTTFHQSYGYEEFIEGIRPVLADGKATYGQNRELQYVISDGIFKKICKRANAGQKGRIPYDEDTKVWLIWFKEDSSITGKDACFRDDVLRFEETGDIFTKNTKHNNDESKYTNLQQMKQGDIVLSFAGIDGKINNIGIVDDNNPRYQEKQLNEEGYWECKVKWNEQEITFVLDTLLGEKAICRRRGPQLITGISISEIVEIAEKAIEAADGTKIAGDEDETEELSNRYVLIIDEINRGNISKIFGELITLIEETKREGAREEMSALLPYSGESFSVPDNVYILGTMNTADRSIALMDTALRRRFSFVEMMPNPDILTELRKEPVVIEGRTIDIARMLGVINERIEYLFDREHTIGHAFFIKLMNDPSIEILSDIFEKNVIPLLQEYFYEDYEKIQLVLGDNEKPDDLKFVLDQPVKERDLFNGNPDLGLSEKKYKIQKKALSNIESYKQIGKGI